MNQTVHIEQIFRRKRQNADSLVQHKAHTLN